MSIVQSLKGFGYTTINDDGMCYGITHSAIAAVMQRQWPIWLSCYRLMISSESSKDLLEAVNQARLRHRNEVKKRWIQPKSHQWLLVLHKMLKSLAVESVKKDQVLRALPAVMDSIVVYQHSSDDTPFFLKMTQPKSIHFGSVPEKQDYSATDRLLQTEKNVLISQLRSDTRESFESLLHDIHKGIQNNHQVWPFTSVMIAMEVLFFNHAVAIVYDGQQQRFFLIDHDELIMKEAEESVFDLSQGKRSTLKAGGNLWTILMSRRSAFADSFEDTQSNDHDQAARLSYHLRVFASDDLKLDPQLWKQSEWIVESMTYDALMAVSAHGSNEEALKAASIKQWDHSSEEMHFKHAYPKFDYNPLTWAVLRNDLPTVKKLLEQGISINTLTMQAVFKNNCLPAIRQIVIDAEVDRRVHQSSPRP